MDYSANLGLTQAADHPPPMDFGADWRSQFNVESRQRIVNKIMETLKRHVPYSGQEGLNELKQIAIRFEEKIYSVATNQCDYLRKISLKMMTVEANEQNQLPQALPSTSAGAGASVNVQDLASFERVDLNCEIPSQAEHPPPMDGGDWRSQFEPESRLRIINKILETLKRHIPYSGEEGLQELRIISARFEEKIFTAATSQTDYLRKISLKMLTMESQSQRSSGPRMDGLNSYNPMSDQMKQIAEIEENMCSAAISKPDYQRKIDRLKDAINKVLTSEELPDA